LAKAQAASAAQTSQSAEAKEQPAAEEKKKAEEEVKAAEAEVDEKRELEELFERVGRAANHYQVLGVSRNIEQDALKQTYHRLARRFHPDRFHQDPQLRSRVEDVFAKIAQAYEVLRDKSSRAAYDLKIEREKDVRPTPRAEPKNEPTATQTSSSPAAQRAEESFQRGLSALKAGNQVAALGYFAEAARLQPKVARYRAQYGRALTENVQMRHRAEAEIQAAIMLEPGNITYRIMLARLFQNLGFLKRAEGELERVRSIDPGNAEAKAMLAELQSMQGAR
jgi:DnaJ-domain-containing protein 1